MTDSTSRHAEFELATNTALSGFPNVEAKREEQRNCLNTLLTRSTQSPTGRFSLQLLCIFIAWVNDLYWNGFLSKWPVFVCHLNRSRSLAFIFSRSLLLSTAPHYLNAWNRLVWINSSNHSHFWASLANLFSRIFRRHFTMTSISNKIKRNATTARTPISQPSNPPPFPVNETQYYINTMRLDWVYDTTKTYPSNRVSVRRGPDTCGWRMRMGKCG